MRKFSAISIIGAGVVIVLIASLAIFVWTRISPYQTEDDPANFPAGTTSSIENAKDFLFILGQGSGWHGYDVLKVDDNGTCEATFGGERTGKWRRAKFSLTSNELTQLQKKLVELDVFALKRAYHNTSICDGTQWFLKIQGGGKRKAVYCNNYFPSVMTNLSNFVEQQIKAPHVKELDTSTEIELTRESMEKEGW
jgi:hypothetical protein